MVKDLVKNLRAQGWELWIENDQLNYACPGSALQEETISELKKYKKEILELLAFEGNCRILPATSAQQALWFLYQLNSAAPAAHNSAFALVIHGKIDLNCLQVAVQRLIDRHPCLRTAFQFMEGKLFQVVRPYVTARVEQPIDAHSWSEQELQQHIQEYCQRPFNLINPSLLRIAVFECSEQKQILLIVSDHLVVDGWSYQLIVQQLGSFYAEVNGTEKANMASLSATYAEFVHYESQSLVSQKIKKQREYWRQQLSQHDFVLNLPTDYVRPSVYSYQGSSVYFKLPIQLVAQLKQVAVAQSISLNVLLLTAFQILLHRYSGQDDLLVAVPTPGRTSDSRWGQVVGYFANLLVIRGKITNNLTIKQFSQQIYRTLLDAFAHQDYPFIKLVDDLQPQRDASRTPICQTSFTLQKFLGTESSSFSWGGLHVEHLEIPLFEGQFDLSVEITERNQELQGYFKYNIDLFEPATIQRMVGHFTTLLNNIVADSEQTVALISMLAPTERQLLLTKWNQTQQEYPQEKCLHQLFAEQAQLTPHAIAVVFENQALSYQDLDAKANQLAHYLQNLGVVPDTLVGICVERSLAMVIGLLGILKAGGAYVPIDPAYPSERIAFTLEDAQVSVLLTQEHLSGTLSSIAVRKICLDRDWSDITQHSKDNPFSQVTAKHLAYVIYTSGSTGKPKGVLITHANVIRLFAATEQYFHFHEQDVWTLFHSYAFDFSVWEIFGGLLYGGKVVVVPYWISRSPHDFYQLLLREGVTVLNQTPSAFQQLIKVEEEKENLELLKLRYIILSGESLNPANLQPWFKRHGDKKPQLINMYGITETTVIVTYYPLTKSDMQSSRNNIGQAFHDFRLYILDINQQLVPIGVPGELYVGGAGLARGYLNRPEVTAEKFIADPFRLLSEERLYKTGDLVRYLADGSIEYLGRIDHQVKIKGFRIELGEIEAILNRHEAVREAVVVVREHILNDKYLAAYLVAKRADQPPSIEDLRTYLQHNLPSFMIPTAFVFLEVMPLTINGKVDGKALPAPEYRSTTDYIAPRNQTEQILAAIWAQVLKIKQVSIDDGFFNLGGDSIKAIQVVSLGKQQGLIINLQQLFLHQSIRELAQILSQSDKSVVAAVPLQPFALISLGDQQTIQERFQLVEDAYPLSSLQLGMLFHSLYHPQAADYHDIFSFHLKLPLMIEVLQKAWEELLQHHEILRTGFFLDEFTEPLQLIFAKVASTVAQYDLSIMTEQEQEQALAAWLETERYRSFNWTQPPLAYFQVHKRSEETFNLTLSCHHSILDGWSVANLLTELLQRYLNAIRQPVFAMSEKTVISRFRDYIALEKNAIQETVSQQYWQQQLAYPTIGHLPRWKPKESTNHTGHAVELISMSDSLSAALQQLAKQNSVSIKSVLLAAHVKVLGTLFNEQDVITGLVTNGRPEDQGAEQTLGLFLNTLPLRVQLTPGTWLELIRLVYDIENQMLPHRRYPLVQIQNAHRGKPLFETIFNFTHFHIYQQINQIEGLELLEHKALEQTNFALVANFSCDAFTNRLSLTLNYDICEFEVEQIKKIGIYYLNTLNAMVSNPQSRYDQFSVLSLSERHTLLTAWNQTEKHFPSRCVHELIEEQARLTPEATAVIFADKTLNYQELNTRANQLAHHLQALDIVADTLVGILVERSLEMVIGLLGVLKAGGTYVPIDPGYPPARIAFMLEDARVAILLTQKSLLAHLPPTDAKIICLDKDWSEIACRPYLNPSCRVKPEHLAYVIYTSGSTGKPKGVQLTHQGLSNFLQSMLYQPGMTSRDRLLAVTTLSFDIATLEIYLPLICGATVLLASREEAQDGLRLKSMISESQPTIMQATPATWRMLLDSGWTPLRLKMLCGGEALSVELAQQLIQNDGELWNLYGPTETTVWATLLRVTPTEIENAVSNISIGRPIANTQTYILDKYQRPLPLGVTGELHIGGVQVACGYLNHPDLTAEKFVTDPFNSTPGVQLYKTGDLARYLPNGAIEYLGRMDYQVKIRGVRIELGEIEAKLASFTGIQQAVVLAKEYSTSDSLLTGDKHLVGYYVAATPLDHELILNYLSDYLPSYMTPTTLVWLNKMPLTANGKLDRTVLPDPQWTDASHYIAPRNELETQVCEVYADVLGLPVEQVGIQDDFFRLGGNSISAIKLVSRLNSQVFNHTESAAGRRVSIAQLFQYRTITNLLDAMSSHDTHESITIPRLYDTQEAISQGLDKTAPLSFAQERLWFIERYTGGSSAYNIPFFQKLAAGLDWQALERSLQAVIVRHEILHSLIKMDDEGLGYQEVVDLKVMPFMIEHCFLESQDDLNTLVATETYHVFHLDNEYPIRIRLIEMEDKERYLLLVVHHIAFDGWSIDVFIRDLRAYYEYYHYHRALDLPKLSIQYKDFAVWQKKYLSGERWSNLLFYWKTKLSNWEILNLPTDKLRPTEIDYSGQTVYFHIDRKSSKKLRKLAKKHHVSLYSVLLAGFNLLLRSYTGQDDIILGTPVANRHYEQLEPLIGFFVNNLVLRSRICPERTLGNYIEEMGKDVIEAQLHQDFPFEKLVDELILAKDSSRHPIFQVMFGVQNFGKQDKNIRDLFIDQNFKTDNYSVSRFDLTVFIDDSHEQLEGMLNYATSLFLPETINTLISTYLHVLNQLPDELKQISQLTYLNLADYKKLITDWNQIREIYPVDKFIHQQFEEQVNKTPDHIAVVYNDVSLTYRELNQRANQLAYYLQETYAIQADDLIALCLDRNEQMLIAILAVLKSGAAYVPLDPNYLENRMLTILEDLEAKAILANEIYETKLTAIISTNRLPTVLELIDGNEKQKILLKYPTIDLALNIQKNHLAYVIYTSGSTGKPKGVMIEQGSFLITMQDIAKVRQLAVNSKVCVTASYIFDAFITEFFTAIITGSTVFLLPESLRKDIDGIIEFFYQYKITHLFLTTKLAELILGKDIQLDFLSTAGELLGHFSKPDGIHHVINEYGPTEATVGSTFIAYENQIDGKNIGKKLNSKSLYILDANLIPLPRGAIGELYIGGPGLARGYLNLPELTAEKFIHNPFCNEEEKQTGGNTRLYRTGDLVRYLPNGNIEYIGRNDSQIKIRGFRIELREIETQLAKYSGVKQAVVLMQGQHLIGYYVSTAPLNHDAMLTYLAQYLPDYARLTGLIWLEKLPLTSNGKLDHKALLAVKHYLPSSKEHYSAPKTEIEKTIAQIWQKLLQREKIGTTDNFFDLGGHSLLLIQMQQQLNKVLKCDLSIVDLYQYPTIRALVKYLEEGEKSVSLLTQAHQRAQQRKNARHARQSVATTKEIV